MIYDLHRKITALNAITAEDKMLEAMSVMPPVGLVALNGIPFLGKPVTYFGQRITMEKIQEQCRNALGLGGTLTYLNTSKFTLDKLAEISMSHNHDWAMRSVNATLCFVGCPTFVELSFARDSRFHLSWVEPTKPADYSVPRIFTATASLKDWKKYTANRTSPDFRKVQRTWLFDAHSIIFQLYPEYFGKE